MKHSYNVTTLQTAVSENQLKEFRKEGEIQEEDIGLFKVWTAIKKKLVHVTASLDNDRENVPESGPTDKTDEDREEVSVEEVDHDLVTESGPDDIMDVDRDQLGIFNYDSVGQYGFPIGPIVEAAIEDDDEDSPMEDGDEDDVTENG